CEIIQRLDLRFYCLLARLEDQLFLSHRIPGYDIVAKIRQLLRKGNLLQIAEFGFEPCLTSNEGQALQADQADFAAALNALALKTQRTLSLTVHAAGKAYCLQHSHAGL